MNRNKRAANRVARGGEVRERTKRWLEAKGLKLNETKTRVVDIRQEGVNFLGFNRIENFHAVSNDQIGEAVDSSE